MAEKLPTKMFDLEDKIILEVNRTKRVSVVPPIISPSSSRIKLRRDNERLVKKLEQSEFGLFGIKKWFNCN